MKYPIVFLFKKAGGRKFIRFLFIHFPFRNLLVSRGYSKEYEGEMSGWLSTETAMAVQKLLKGKVESHLLTIDHIKDDFMADIIDDHLCQISVTACHVIRMAHPDHFEARADIAEVLRLYVPHVEAVGNGDQMVPIIAYAGRAPGYPDSVELLLKDTDRIPSMYVVGQVEVSQRLLSAFRSIGARTVPLDSDLFDRVVGVGVFKERSLSDELHQIIGIAELLK